jgi:hypothetical protein
MPNVTLAFHLLLELHDRQARACRLCAAWLCAGSF